MRNVGLLNLQSVVTLFKSYCCSFHGYITVMDLENVVHDGINVFEEYKYHDHIRQQFHLRDIKCLHRVFPSPTYIVRPCIMNL